MSVQSVDIAMGKHVVRDMTDEERAQRLVDDQIAAEYEQRRQVAAAARALVVQTAGSAAGIAVTALTPAQVRALLAVLLWQAGALDEAGRVRPLAAWVQA